MNKLKQIVTSNETYGGKIFDWVIQTFIIISLITFSVETLPNLTIEIRSLLRITEAVTVIVFTVEYFLRIYYNENKLKFIFSFYGMIDLLSILPFYLAAGIDLRTLRSLRLMRIFSTLKIVRYNKALQRLNRAVVLAKEELILFLSLTCILIFIASVGIYYFENQAQPEKFSSIFDGLWWSVATLTTVGFGDIYPITVGGKIFTFIILMIGLGVVAVPAGIFSSALTKAREID